MCIRDRDKEMCLHGNASGKRGRSPTFSDGAIQFCLTIKGLFNLALRQATGMVQSLLKLAGLGWQVADFSTVNRGRYCIHAVLRELYRLAYPDDRFRARTMPPCRPDRALVRARARRCASRATARGQGAVPIVDAARADGRSTLRASTPSVQSTAKSIR